MAIDLGLFDSRINHDVVYPYEREQVWRALTESDLLADWLMENDLSEVTVGETFEFREDPIPFLWDGTVECEILEVDPPRKLVISWEGGGSNPTTEVTWLLEEHDKGTRLKFTHAGFDGLRGLMMKMGLRGWGTKYENSLPAVLNRLENGDQELDNKSVTT